ncbi:MAG: SprB repeat-containing protein, partial [Flavobacteriaceae bacterium]
MLSKKTWLSIYAILFMLFSVSLITVSAEDRRMALTEIFKAFGSEEPEVDRKETAVIPIIPTEEREGVFSGSIDSKAMAALTTIIQGADEEVGCSTNGFTVARFNLCGDFDDRVITLSGSHSTVNWQLLGGSCTPDINDDCPDTTTSCYTTVHTGTSFTLDASTISATSGAEFRVVVDGIPYYFKVKKSTISQTYVKNDFICGVPGRIQITNLSSAYEFSIDNGSGFGPWQGPIFNNLTPGTYVVKARLQNIPNTCEYPYEPITIAQRDIDIDVSFVDVLCSGETGAITVTANNVPGPYKYTLLDENGVPQEFTAFIPDNPYTFSAVGFGTYTVQVETQQCTGDLANGIDPPRQDRDTTGNPITIGGGITALDASTEVNNSFGCANITSVDIRLNVTGGQAPYTDIVNGSGPASAPFTGSVTHTVTTAGTYDFLITDDNGCTITASSDVEELLPPDVTVTGVDGTCSNGGARLVFTINDARGYNLSYRADSGDAWDNNNQLSVAAGTYNTIQVRYQQGGFECTMDMPSVTVTTVDAISGNAVKMADRSCGGSGGVNGGQIDFQGPFSGGSGSGYTFSIDGVNFTSITSYNGLAPGTYTPMIEDGGGCRLELTPITILDVDPPTDIDFTQDNVNCAANTADVQLTPTSNAAIVNYSIIAPTTINNGGNDTFTGLDISTSYIFQITDANNCTYTEGFTPQLISSIRARVKSGGDLRVCTGASDGSGTFLIDGFANTYTYNINGGTESTAQNDTEIQITGLAAGTYTVTVTDTDSGCSDSVSFDVEEPTTPLDLTGNVTPMSCANNNLGRVVANATGGWGSYRYTLEYPGGTPVVGPKSGRTFGNLSAAGTYTLTVTDAEGCSATHTFTLTTIDSPDVVVDSGASNICHVPGTGATVAVSSTAGSAPLASHQYRINGGTLQASPVFTGLTPGSYTIEVVDGNNCSDSINVTINPRLRVNTNIAAEIPCGGAPGQIQVNVNGGYTVGAGTKQYEVSADGGTTFGAPSPLTSNSFLFDTNVPGDYVFRVTDNEGCVAESSPVTLNPPQTIDPATLDITPVSCGGSDNGRVVITPDATSGIPPYEISFNGGAFGTQNVFSNLTVGTYQVVVRDARGCETTPVDAVVSLNTTAVPNATVSEVQATCNAGATSGGISIDSVADGSPNFIFIVEDAFGNEVTRLEDVDPVTLPRQLLDPALVPGDYRVITLDANGCTDEDMVTITTNEVVIAPINFTPPVTCDDTAFTYTVRVTPTIFPTVPTYQIRLAGQPAFYALNNNAGPDTHEFSNASDGIMYGVTYTVEVLAPNGCIYEQEIPPVEGPSTLDVTASSTPGFCDANRNGQISYSITGYTIGDQLQVQLINNDAGTTTAIETVTTTVAPHTNTVEDLPGNYQILVTNLSDTCTDAVSVTIDQNLPSIDILNLEPATCNSNGSFTVQGRGGSGGPFGYAFMDAGVTPTNADFGTQTTYYGPAGTYDVYVRDSSGCTSFAIARIIPDNTVLPAPTFVVNNQCDPTSTSFDIVVRVPNTVDTPRFDLNGDEQFGTLNGSFYEHTYSVGTPGDYVVDVMDANGCTSQGTARVFEFLT